MQNQKGKEKLFAQIYRFDNSTGSYIIEIALDRYADIFSEWDAAPFKLRDIDPDLELYLEGCSDDIPYRYPVSLCFTLPQNSINLPIEQQARNGLKNGFTFKRYFIKKEIKAVNRRTLLFFIIGFAFLWVAAIFPKQLLASPFPSIIVEGLFIGGWVFLWEAITLILFTTGSLRHKDHTYKRLQRSSITFRKKESESQ